MTSVTFSPHSYGVCWVACLGFTILQNKIFFSYEDLDLEMSGQSVLLDYLFLQQKSVSTLLI